jgi:succinate-acetate transporter protein
VAEVVPETPANPTNPLRNLIANPVPAGVAGFALTTFTLGLYTSGNYNTKGEVVVFALAAFYGGLTQFVAGWFAMARGDLFPAAFMTTYGAFWLTFVALNLFVVPAAGAAATQAVSIFLIMWTVITFIFTVASFFTNWVVFITFVEFLATIIILDVASVQANSGLQHVGGYLEMVLGALAWYVVLGEVVNDVAGRALFPFPLTPVHLLPTVKGEPASIR